MKIEVIYLAANKQAVMALDLPENTRLIEAIQLSKLLENFPEIDLNRNKVGIFSKIVPLDTLLKDGDRVEIYRPLLVDPKQKRRLKASTRPRQG